MKLTWTERAYLGLWYATLGGLIWVLAMALGCAKKLEPTQSPATNAIKVPALTDEEWNTIGTNLDLLVPVTTNELFRLSTNGTSVVTIKHNGEVIYDTNNVSGATAFFWKTLSELIARQK